MPKNTNAPANLSETYLTVAIDAARGAARLIMAALGTTRTYSRKRITDLVTDTDRQAEALILDTIQQHFPDHEILAEESGTGGSKSDYRWVVDPLDGTTNFVHGYPSFAVSIGLMVNHRPVLGVVVELPANHLYTAVAGQGAFRDGNPISVSRTANLQDALLVTGFGYEHGPVWERNMALFRLFTDKTQGVRRLGAAAVDLCHVACGQVDGFWEFDLAPWDTAAGWIIVQEAGGQVTQLDGGEYSIDSPSLLATNGRLHKAIMEMAG